MFIGLGIGLLHARELKVLMLENSLSDSVGVYLPEIVKVSGHQLELTDVYIGGCSLEQHSKNLTAAEKDPSHRPYRKTVWNSDSPDKPQIQKGNVNELLTLNHYDVISIQQGGSEMRAGDTGTVPAGEEIRFTSADCGRCHFNELPNFSRQSPFIIQ